jgi:hypothetical protein
MLRLLFALILLALVTNSKAALKVNFTKLENFKPDEIEKINKSKVVIEEILNSKEFKLKVENHTYEGKRMFVDTELSNEEVYAKIMRGAESYSLLPDGNMDIGLSMYYSMSSTIGYTYPASDTINLNRKHHNGYDEYSQPQNIVHEWTHKLGFEHAQKWSKSRDYSVPYGVGSIVTELAANLKQDKKFLTRLSDERKDIFPFPDTTPSAPVKDEPAEDVCWGSWKSIFSLKCWRELF